MAQTVKNLPAMWEAWALSLVWEDPLEKGMTTHSIVLAWRILMDRGAWQASWGHRESDTAEQLSTQHTSYSLEKLHQLFFQQQCINVPLFLCPNTIACN